MNFEGFTLNNPQDVEAALRSKRTTRGNDWYPWAWLPRFCRAHSDKKHWAEESLLKLYDEALTGGRPRPTPQLNDVITHARLCSFPSFLPRLREGLVEAIAPWSDGEKHSLFGWIISFSPSALSDAEIKTIRKFGGAELVFPGALHLLLQAAPQEGVALVEAHFTSLLHNATRTTKLLSAVSFFYWHEAGSDYRRRIAAALASIAPAHRATFLEMLRGRYERTRSAAVTEAALKELAAHWSNSALADEAPPPAP